METGAGRVLRAQSGDREALDELLREIQGPLFRYLVSLTRDEALAEDILQTALFTICQKIGWLEEPELFRAWCYRIAARHAFKTLEREKRWRHTLRDDEILNAIPSDPPRDSGDVQRLINRAPRASRPVLVLFYVEGLRLEEIAEALGVATGTVKSRLAYGLQSLRRLMQEKS